MVSDVNANVFRGKCTDVYTLKCVKNKDGWIEGWIDRQMWESKHGKMLMLELR